MNTDTKVKILEQAQAARASANWLLLIQCLQQLVQEEKLASRGRKIPLLESELEQVLDLAIEVLVVGDFNQRWDIAKVFPKLGKSAITPIIEILSDEDADEELRWYAARILREFNYPEAIAALVELLKTSESEELKAIAATALGEIGETAVAALTHLLTQESTRELAVRSLSQIRCKETIAPLLSVVQDSQVEIRVAAIEALGSFHDPRIPPVLLKALDDLAAPVRREAVIGLGFRSDLQAKLDLVNCLLPRLYDFNLDVCIAAAIALGRLGTDAAATGLFRVLQSPHTPLPLQTEIVRSLGRIGTQTSLEYLHSSLHQQALMPVWQEIVTVLGRVEQPDLSAKAAEILLALVRYSDLGMQQTSLKQALALSLSQLGEMQAMEGLIQLLADPEMAVRLHAIAALKQLAPEAAYEQLQQMASSASLTPQLRQGVAIALQEW